MKVKELKKQLASFNPEAQVQLVDASSGWPLSRIKLDTGKCVLLTARPVAGTVYIWGTFHDVIVDRYERLDSAI